MKVIVAGSRTITNYNLVKNAIDEARQTGLNITTIIDGTARGVDSLASRYAVEHGIDNIRMAADWKRFGKVAGRKRNELMAENGDALIAIWDGTSTGTKHMLECAKARNLQIVTVITPRNQNLKSDIGR